MSEFFEPLPSPTEWPRHPRFKSPPWLGAPSGTLPGIVALELVLARNDKVAVCVTHALVYPEGFRFDVVVMSAEWDPELDPHLFGPPQMFGAMADDIRAKTLRVGVQFADGRKATNGHHFDSHDPHVQPTDPVMHPMGGGGGGGGGWHQTLWVWPLPPTGPLAFVCRWPVADIALTRGEIDAQLVLDAAARAQVVFSEEDLPEFPGEDGGVLRTPPPG